jgi:Flp pilus assembly protein TadD
MEVSDASPFHGISIGIGSFAIWKKEGTLRRQNGSAPIQLSQKPESSRGYPRLVCLIIVAFLLGSDCLRAQSSSKSEDLRTDLQRGQIALKANRRDEAAKEFRAALRLDPGNAEANANLGVLSFFHGDCREAENEFRGALKTAPSLKNAKALLAVCEKRLGEPSAQVDLTSAFADLQDVRMRTQVGIELADLYYQQGDLGETGSVLYTLSSINPDNVDILFFEQRVYSELAGSTLDKLALLAPDSARMEQLIAERLINAGDLKNAIVHFRKALALDPKLPGTHFELAEALMEGSPNDAKAQSDAASELQTAITVDGDSSKIECELGRIAVLQSNLTNAETHYQHAYQLNSNDAQADLGLAELLRTQDKPEEAAKYLRMAVAADPLNPEAHYKLSQVDKQLHLDEEQKKELQLFIEIRASKDKIQHLYQQMKPEDPSTDQKSTSPSR